MAEHKDIGYDFGHKPKDHVDPETSAGLSLPYKAISRIINMTEDLHAQMQKPVGERFKGYPIEKYEDLDTTIRDTMANLALSLETRSLSERNTE